MLDVPDAGSVAFGIEWEPSKYPIFTPRTSYRLVYESGQYQEFSAVPVWIDECSVRLDLIELTEVGSIYDRQGAD